MESNVSDNVLHSIDTLSKLYEKIDIFDTIMESLEEMLDNAIGLYENIEEMTIYKCTLEESDKMLNKDEIDKLSVYINEKTEILNTLLGNAAELASNIN